jgi:hypothetical protein
MIKPNQARVKHHDFDASQTALPRLLMMNPLRFTAEHKKHKYYNYIK